MNNRWRATLSHHVGWGVLILLCSLAAAGCAQPVAKIDTTSFGPSQDHMAIAGYYRDRGHGSEREGRRDCRERCPV